MKEILSKEKEIAEKISKRFNREVRIQNEKRVWVSIEKDELLEFLKWLKQEGFLHLSAISVSDWLAEKQFKIDYLLWSYLDNIMVILTVKIDRENPVIDS
ncbi:MAG: NADH-quinone oxidoreductase subunit C, partial [Candidatus Atribacteria bacterium]|nr:NADH-quinone oxidoreductase subunit C [Candidatus Atribacteria bacterium]